MIKVDRQPLPDTDAAQLAQWQAQADGYQPGQDEIQKDWKRFTHRVLGKRIRGSLEDLAREKCLYCESKGASEIEHYYPKEKYPRWLFRWDNFNWSCSLCNSNKGNHFEYGADGQPLTLNPTGDEEVADYFFIDTVSGAIKPRHTLTPGQHARAEYTIRRLKLDRTPLRNQRRAVAELMIKALYACGRHGSRETEDLLLHGLNLNQPMRAVVRQIIRSRDPEIRRLVEKCIERFPRIAHYIGELNWR